jgi:hypothetical protein
VAQLRAHEPDLAVDPVKQRPCISTVCPAKAGVRVVDPFVD